MKVFFILTAFTAISLFLCGCMSAREEQNPQPRTSIPCQEWAAAQK